MGDLGVFNVNVSFTYLSISVFKIWMTAISEHFEFESVYWPFLDTRPAEFTLNFFSLLLFFSFLINILVLLYSSFSSSLWLVLDLLHVVLVHIPWNNPMFFVYLISLSSPPVPSVHNSFVIPVALLSLMLIESSFQSILSFLNIMVFSLCAHLYCLVFVWSFPSSLLSPVVCTVFGRWCLVLTRLLRTHLPSRSPWFLSGSVSTSVWPFFFIGQVAPLFVSSLGFLLIS
jgi:hypothetical protein